MIKKFILVLLLFPFALQADPMSGSEDLAKECVRISKDLNHLSATQTQSQCQMQLQSASIGLTEAARALFSDNKESAAFNLKYALSYIYLAENYECEQSELIHLAGEEVKQVQNKV